MAVVGPFGNVAGQRLPIEFNTIPPTQSLVAAVVVIFGASSNNLGKFGRFWKVEKSLKKVAGIGKLRKVQTVGKTLESSRHFRKFLEEIRKFNKIWRTGWKTLERF